MLMEKITEQLRRDEGEVLHAYSDSLGYTTIGVGRLIDPRKGGGITKEESAYLLTNDIMKRKLELDKRLPWWSALDDARQAVLLNMAFQMGVDGLLNFANTLALIKAGDYVNASQEMLQSAWARQTPARARRLSDQMKTGEFQ